MEKLHINCGDLGVDLNSGEIEAYLVIASSVVLTVTFRLEGVRSTPSSIAKSSFQPGSLPSMAKGRDRIRALLRSLRLK